MKKRLIPFFVIATLALPSFAQTPEHSKGRVIEVTGSAELEIVPDQIYLSITLREYMRDKSKIRLDDIDKAFRSTINDLKIDPSSVSIEGASGYHDWDYWRQRNTEFLASKTYIVKLADMARYNSLMQRLDNQGVQNVYLQRTDHSHIEEYRKQVKVEALKAAKEKARMLLEAIGEQPGEVLFIREAQQNNYYPMYKAMSNVAMDAGAESAPMNADMQKIRLRYEVEAHFRIR